MGKAAENERIKLKATFCNNLSVGLCPAGFLIPYLQFIGQLGDFIDWSREATIGRAQIAKVIANVFAMGLAFYGAYFFQRELDRTIKGLKD